MVPISAVKEHEAAPSLTTTYLLITEKSHGTQISADSAGSKRFHFKWLHVIFDDACPTSSGVHSEEVG